jgi:hypothetical protein
MGAHTSKLNKTEVIATATTLSIFFAIVLGVSIYIAIYYGPEGYSFANNAVYFFQIIFFVIYFLILLPYNLGRVLYESYIKPQPIPFSESAKTNFIDNSWSNPVWNFLRIELIIKALFGDADMFYRVKADIKQVLEIINKFLNQTAAHTIDSVYDTIILEEEFPSDESYVNELFRYIYFAAMYIFSLVVLNYKHTDIIGFVFVGLLNIASLVLFSTDLGKIMGPVFKAPFIFVYFPWLVLAAASGLILYIVFRLKWASSVKEKPIKFLKHEEETYKRMKHVMTATIVIMLCLSALFTFARSSAMVRLIMVLLLAATLSLDVVLLTDAVQIFKKDIKHMHTGPDPGNGIQEPDLADQLYNVFQNINLNYMLNHDTNLGL